MPSTQQTKLTYTRCIKELPVLRCTFAYSGTYGHECGARAVKVAVKRDIKTDKALGSEWVDGIYYAGRCTHCASIKGGENAGCVIEELDINKHVNKLAYWTWE